MPNDYHPSSSIPAPSHDSFTARFGDAFPKPQYLTTELGQTAIYHLPAPGQVLRRVLIIHGLNTPALGLLELAQHIQTLSPWSHLVLYDLWGHGLTSSPGVQHSPEIFQQQIHDVLAHLKWESADIIGFSFGGSTAVRFAVESPGKVNTLTILAPAGLLDRNSCDHEIEEVLSGSARQGQAEERVLEFLEGGELRVPADWKEKMHGGAIVPQALRRFELDEHRGFRASLTSMFRHGGVFGCEDIFVKAHGLAVLGEKDDVCSSEQLKELGWKDVRVVKRASHELPRSHVGEVAKIVVDCWEQK